jgi:hypothetical protein
MGVLIGLLRVLAGGFTVSLVLYAYGLSVSNGNPNPFDFFGYFTTQTNLMMGIVLILGGAFAIAGLAPPSGLVLVRGAVTAYLIVVAIVYNVFVPGTGSAPPWVSAILHVVVPALAILDWLLVGDRRPLLWRRLWLVLAYPAVWLTVVLIRGATDGWVPYGFLLPERGAISLMVHVVVLVAAVLAAGALVWLASRLARGSGAPPSIYIPG